MMGNSQAVKEKLVLVLLNLACRAIDEAKRVPYQIEQDNLVDILINDPSLYQQMVQEGELDGKGIPQGRLLVKLDILRQIEEFDPLDRFDMRFDNPEIHPTSHSLIFAQINILTKLFLAYHSNMVTTFEKEYNQFLERYYKTVEETGHQARSVKLGTEDLTAVRDMAAERLARGRYVEAFSLAKLFDPELMKKGPFQFVPAIASLLEGIIHRAPLDEPNIERLVRFSLRACYMSHNHWNELFHCLATLSEREPARYSQQLIVDLIDSDFVFACNLLHRPFDELRAWPSCQRKDAILECLRKQIHSA